MTEREIQLTNRVRDLECQLVESGKLLDAMQERLTLSDGERAILAGQPDGCIRLGDVRPIIRRAFGDGVIC